ncbi:MAG: TIR domain-containing protein [Anaerolineales bacterium]|nr:TIR domain-containing protein [Anaerolineales bacterium]
MPSYSKKSILQMGKAISEYWNSYSDAISIDQRNERSWLDTRITVERRNIILNGAIKLVNSFALLEGMILINEIFSDDEFGKTVRFSLGSLPLYVVTLDNPEVLLSDSGIQEYFSTLQENQLNLVIIPIPLDRRLCESAINARARGINVVLIPPADIDELASSSWTLSEMARYKIFKVFLEGTNDADAKYIKWEVERFRNEVKKIRRSNDLITIDEAIKKIKDDPSEWVKHPKLTDLTTALESRDAIILSGPSASGKSTLAFAAGKQMLINNRENVAYIDAGELNSDKVLHIGSEIFNQFVNNDNNSLLLIVDDIHTQPSLSRHLIGFVRMLQSSILSSRLKLLAISWPHYIGTVKKHMLLPKIITIEAADISEILIREFGKGLNKESKQSIKERAGEDLLILRMWLDNVGESFNASKTINDLASAVWQKRSANLRGEKAPLRRAVFIASAIGRYDCDVSKSFITSLSGIEDVQLDELVRSKILMRKTETKYSLPHRSFANLMAKYFNDQQDIWEWLKSNRRITRIGDLIVRYFESLAPSEIWSTLELINWSGGIKVTKESQSRVDVLIEIWKLIDALLTRIYEQQREDSSWAGTISSAAFACEALSSVGKFSEAKGSLEAIRKWYSIENGKMKVDIQELSTVEDFRNIRSTMREEEIDNTAKPGGESSDEINIEKFHENWATGIVLVAEASVGVLSDIELENLARSIEGRVEKGDYFYPSRVPWCTARILMGLGQCGRNINNSTVVQKVADWLMRGQVEGGARDGNLWKSGTGPWNSSMEVTAMVILGLLAVGVSTQEPRLVAANNWLIEQKKRGEWVKPGQELDGALAAEAYLKMHGSWRDIQDEVITLANWADNMALWRNATISSKESFDQSCRAAQVGSFLIKVMWSTLREELPHLLNALGLSSQEIQGTEDESRNTYIVESAEYDYDVAISYAAEDSKYVNEVAKHLKDAGVNVFFDKFLQVELWGENLYTHLDEIYRKKARYCVMFLSIHYANKAWTSHERESAQARAFKENQPYILPVRFDETDIPGIVSTIGYIDASKVSPKKLSKMIMDKLATR